MLWIVIVLLLVLFFGICYFTYRITFYSFPVNRKEIMSLPPGEQFKRESAKMGEIIRELQAIEFEKVTITSFDGIKLVARYYHTKDGAPLHIQFHGYRGSGIRDFCGGNKIARELGHNTLLVTQRASGESGGRTITFGIKEYRDCMLWIEYAIERFGRDAKIILSGISMGAATVLKASGEELAENIVGIIADSPFSSAEKIIKKVCCDIGLNPSIVYPFISVGAKLYGRINLKDGDVLYAVKKSKKPILLIHGEEDRFVPCDMSHEILENCGCNARLETFSTAGHGLSYIVNEKRYKKLIEEFVAECLSK